MYLGTVTYSESFAALAFHLAELSRRKTDTEGKSHDAAKTWLSTCHKQAQNSNGLCAADLLSLIQCAYPKCQQGNSKFCCQQYHLFSSATHTTSHQQKSPSLAELATVHSPKLEVAGLITQKSLPSSLKKLVYNRWVCQGGRITNLRLLFACNLSENATHDLARAGLRHTCGQTKSMSSTLHRKLSM